MKYYLCAVPKAAKENYDIGVRKNTWGVEEKYKDKIFALKEEDVIIFIVDGKLRGFHSVIGKPFIDKIKIWEPKGDDYYPYRVKISDAIYSGDAPLEKYKENISIFKGYPNWGLAVQGRKGVLNDKLTTDDVEHFASLLKKTVKQKTPDKLTHPPQRLLLSEKNIDDYRQNKPREPIGSPYYERDVESLLIDKLHEIGLELYIDSQTGKSGKQFTIDNGHARIDLLCLDKNNDEVVVIEIKRGQASAEVFTQIGKYMCWIRDNFARGKKVRGIIFTEEKDMHLENLLTLVPDVIVKYYKVSIDLLL